MQNPTKYQIIVKDGFLVSDRSLTPLKDFYCVFSKEFPSEIDVHIQLGYSSTSILFASVPYNNATVVVPKIIEAIADGKSHFDENKDVNVEFFIQKSSDDGWITVKNVIKNL